MIGLPNQKEEMWDTFLKDQSERRELARGRQTAETLRRDGKSASGRQETQQSQLLDTIMLMPINIKTRINCR